jgi:hypothetical protein
MYTDTRTSTHLPVEAAVIAQASQESATQTSTSPEVTTITHPLSIQYQHTLRFVMKLFYKEEYYPTPRHRKPQHRTSSSQEAFYLPYATRQEAPLVMAVRYSNTIFGYRLFNGVLYREHKNYGYPNHQAVTLEQLIEEISHSGGSWASLEKHRALIEEKLSQYVIVENHVYIRYQEPVYVVSRGRIGIENGLPRSHREYSSTFNALEFEAALLSLGSKCSKKAERESPRIRVFDARVLAMPTNNELIQRYEQIEIDQAVQTMTEKLGYFPKNLRRRILEQALTTV